MNLRRVIYGEIQREQADWYSRCVRLKAERQNQTRVSDAAEKSDVLSSRENGPRKTSTECDVNSTNIASVLFGLRTRVWR